MPTTTRKDNASQINGCTLCVDLHARTLRDLGESDERIFAVAAWRDAPFYSDQERAALALAEAVTRIADTAHPVPDDLWARVTAQFDEQQVAALIVAIATINVWNRLNVPTHQPPLAVRPTTAASALADATSGATV